MSEPDTRLIESLAQRRGAMNEEVDDGNFDADDLAYRHNLPRDECVAAISVRRKRGKKGTKKKRSAVVQKAIVQQKQQLEPDNCKTDENYANPILPPVDAPVGLAWAARLIGWGFGVIGFGLNCVYAYQLGDGLLQKLTYAALGGLIDLVSMFGLAWAFALPWYQAIFASFIWALSIIYSGISGAGFTASTLNDNARRTMAVEQYRADLTAQIERATATLPRLPAVIDKDIQEELDRLKPTKAWATSKGCTDVSTSGNDCERLKQLRQEKDREVTRAPITAQIDRLTATRAALQEGGKDMAPEVVASFTGVAPDKINMYRNGLPALMLMFSGMLLAFDRSLRDQSRQATSRTSKPQT